MKDELSKERLTTLQQHPELITRDEVVALLAAHEQEPDYIRYSCGCCGYESLSPVSACPKCNFDNIEETPLFMHPAPSIPAAVPDERDAFEVWALTQAYTTTEFLVANRTTSGYWDETVTGAEANRLWRIWCSIRDAMQGNSPVITDAQ